MLFELETRVLEEAKKTNKTLFDYLLSIFLLFGEVSDEWELAKDDFYTILLEGFTESSVEYNTIWEKEYGHPKSVQGDGLGYFDFEKFLRQIIVDLRLLEQQGNQTKQKYLYSASGRKWENLTSYSFLYRINFYIKQNLKGKDSLTWLDMTKVIISSSNNDAKLVIPLS